MSAHGSDTERVVVALDGSRHSLAALEAAVELARRRHAILTAVFVEEDRWQTIALHPAARVFSRGGLATPDPDAMARDQRALSRELEARARRAAAGGRVEFATRRGDPTRELLDAGRGASVVVLGRTGRITTRTVGTTATQVALGLELPVLLVREGQRVGSPVLLLEDVPTVERALLATIALAWRDGGRATVVAIAESPDVRSALLARAHTVLAAARVQAALESAPSFDAALRAHRGELLVVAPGGSITSAADLAKLVEPTGGPIVIA